MQSNGLPLQKFVTKHDDQVRTQPNGVPLVPYDDKYGNDFLMNRNVNSNRRNSLIMIVRWCLLAISFLLALFPSVIKMYETSHWFREGDPSKYDNAKDFFSNENLPLQQAFDSSKVLMRVYFFIIPYLFSAVALICANLISNLQDTSSSSTSTSTRKRSVKLLGRSIFNQSVSLPGFMVKYLASPQRVSVGEIIGIAVFLFLNVGTFGVRVRRSLPRGTRKLNFLVDTDKDASREPIDFWSWEGCEICAKTLGVLSILNLGWYLLMPIGRRSILLEAIGMSWDRAVKYHRWVGYYSVAIMIIHSLMYFGVFIHGNGHDIYDPSGTMLQHNMLPWGCSTDCDDDQRLHLRINLYGIVAFLLVMVMTAFTLPWIRRQKFEWFYYAHHLFILVLFFVCLHYKGAIMYLVPGVAIYSVDKLLALLSYRKSGYVNTRMVSSDVLEISVPLASKMKYEAGQYVFLNIPEVSHLEWHPFSLTSSPHQEGGEDSFFFHVKEAGTWTRDLISAAKASKDGQLKVRVDGFYGHNLIPNLPDKHGVVLVGGGIGVTPMVSLAMDICETQKSKHVTLLWVVRTIDEFHIFADELCEACHRYGSQLTVKVWITMSRPEPVGTLNNDHDIEKLQSMSYPPTLDRTALSDLDLEGNCQQVIQALQERSKHRRATFSEEAAGFPEKNAFLQRFVMEHIGMSPLMNSFVMFFAMLIGLLAYAYSQSRQNKLEIEPEDKWTLVEMLIIMAVLLFFLGILSMTAIPWRYSTKYTYDRIRSKEMQDSSSYSNTTEMDSSDFSVTEDTGTKHDINQSKSMKESILRSMILGRIGCRPDMVQEFSDIALNANTNSSTTGNDDIWDIGVLACGPVSMVESINRICNNTSASTSVPGSFSVSNSSNDGSNVFFDFTEEDWEW